MDWSLADVLPVFLTILFIVMLILHVLYQRRKISKHLIQRETWKRTRKMFLQLLPIALIFLAFNMLLSIVGLLAISYPWFNTVPYFYANSLSYCLPMCMPFAALVLDGKGAIPRRRYSAGNENVLRLDDRSLIR